MKMVWSACVLFLVTSLSLSAEAPRDEAGDYGWFGTSGYLGYGWGSMSLVDGTPVTTINLDGVPTSIDATVGSLRKAGPFQVGFRGELASATYITGFARDSFGAEHDQAAVELTADGMAAYTGVPWFFPYAFAGATLTYYALFDPVHMADGADETTVGVRAGAGVSFELARFPLKDGSVRILAGPEVMCGILFLQDLFYGYLRVHGLVAVQWVTP